MSSENRYQLDINQIQKYIPHRPPFVMIDRVLEIHLVGSPTDAVAADKTGVKVIAIKNVSVGDFWTQGHFPGYAIMPGVLVIEAMAQTASFSLYPYVERDLKKFTSTFQCALVGVEGARFRKPVVPGDTLRIETVVTKVRGRLWVFECTASVDGQRAAEAEILANLVAGEIS